MQTFRLRRLVAGLALHAPSLGVAFGFALLPPMAHPQAPVRTSAATDVRSARPTLVLFLTVDQLRPDYLERWDHQLTGGFRTLLDKGVFFTRAAQDHAITETAPGHASTLSGRFPYSTGIASNAAGVNTREAPIIGDTAQAGASPFRFQGTVLADWMKGADPSTRVLSVSRKDRGAILPVGRGKHQVYWWGSRSAAFVTSTYYADSLPAWVRAFNAERRHMARAGARWDLLLPETAYPEADSVPAETSGDFLVMPYLMPADPQQLASFFASTPWMDEHTLAFAWRGVRALGLGEGQRTDLLAVSLSTTDAVGHRWGPDSRELHDQVLRLDRFLGVFLDSLFALRGEENVVIALTADHGVTPYPEVRTTWGDNANAVRVPVAAIDSAIRRAAPQVSRSGIDPTAFAVDWPVIEIDRSKAEGKDRELRLVARAMAREIEKVKGVRRVDVIDDLARADTVSDPIARRWLHMFRPGGQALLGITLDPFSVVGRGRGGTHGSPHDSDARVPVILMGAPFATGRRDDGVARVVDIAPTLARVLGVQPLERLDGRVLDRALRERTP
jgi:arylsulfatase A-like enzyme